MTNLVQLSAVCVSIALLVLVVELVRRRLLAEEYALVWLLGTGVLLLFSISRRVLHALARFLGIYYPPALLVLMLVLFGFVAGLYFSVAISRQRAQIERLVKEVSILAAKASEGERGTPVGREPAEISTSSGVGKGSGDQCP